MGRREDRRRYQAALDQDLERNLGREFRHTAPLEESCDAALGRTHDYTMRGPDGIVRCWYCCRRRPEKKGAA
jgi:hypothetical protein